MELFWCKFQIQLPLRINKPQEVADLHASWNLQKILKDINEPILAKVMGMKHSHSLLSNLVWLFSCKHQLKKQQCDFCSRNIIEVEDFSPLESPVSHKDYLTELYQFELLAWVVIGQAADAKGESDVCQGLGTKAGTTNAACLKINQQ